MVESEKAGRFHEFCKNRPHYYILFERCAIRRISEKQVVENGTFQVDDTHTHAKGKNGEQ